MFQKSFLLRDRDALARDISLAPGQLFSAQQNFTHCVRINYGHPPAARLERGLQTVGKLARSLVE